jgi:ribosomal protein S18 acetylase RimI-like enzyme
MKTVIEKLHLNSASQAAGFHEQWVLREVRVITLGGSDVGWLQTRAQDDGLFIAPLFVDGPFQGKGIGTEVVNRLMADATREKKAVLLAVAKINPAIRLYQRLGFRITHEDERKFYMRRDPM